MYKPKTIFWDLIFMRKNIVFLLVLSFLMPSVHFISHEHNYNPTTRNLEHTHKSEILISDSNFSVIQKSKLSTQEDICQINLINNIQKNNYKIVLLFKKHIYNYSYQNTYSKNYNSSKILFFAPKTSPPLV